MAEYLTFENLQDEIERALKVTGGSRLALIKEAINAVYLDELLTADDMREPFWLREMMDDRASVAPVAITGISQAATGVVSAPHSFIAGDLVRVDGVVGMTQVNNRVFMAGTVVAGVSFQLLDLNGAAVATTGYTAWSSGGYARHVGISPVETAVKHGQLLLARWHDQGDPMEIVTGLDDIESRTGDWNASTSRPERIMHRQNFTSGGTVVNQFLWWPAADAAYDLRYWFTRRPVRLENASDVPLLPPQFHRAIISGVVARFAETMGVQIENGVIWPGIYQANVAALVAFNRRWYERGNQPQAGKPYML